MPLDPDALEELLSGAHVAVLATLGRDGGPHQAPVWYLWRDGVALVLTERASQKARNIERDPRVSLCVDTKVPPLRSAVVYGRARERAVDYHEERRRLFEQYIGVEGAEAALAARPIDGAASVVFEIVPERIVSSG